MDRAGEASALVSLVVRTGRGPATIRRTLATIAAQTYLPIEVIVVDDGEQGLAREEVASALGHIASTDVPVPLGCSRAHARNTGIAAARGRFLGFLEAGDELFPHHVAVLVAALASTDAAIAYSDCEQPELDPAPSGGTVSGTPCDPVSSPRDFSRAELCLGNYVPLLGTLFTRELLTDAGGFDDSFEPLAEWDLLLRATRQATVRHVLEVTARRAGAPPDPVDLIADAACRAAFVRVVSRHWDAITPEAVCGVAARAEQERASARSRFALLEREHRELEQLAATREQALQEAHGHEVAFQRIERESEDELAHLRVRLSELTRALQSVDESRAWKLVSFYRAGIKERLLPAGSRRRQVYNRLLRTGDRYPTPPGSARGAHHTVAASHVVWERFVAPTTPDPGSQTLPVGVSVIIPTRNPGDGFRCVLEHLRAQTGPASIEIIAVDAGSTDGTLALCARHGVKVVAYPEGPWSRGQALNAGADAAAGEFLVFVSQDAIPIGPLAIAGLARPLLDDARVAIASARRVPSSDADLFTCWQLWRHRTVVLAHRADTTASAEGETLAALDPLERRRRAQIDNAFSCVRHDVFSRMRFRPLPAAEDLDLGLRLLAQGHAIRFLSSVAAIHSPVRPPAHHFRLAFLERRVVAELLGDEGLDWTGWHATSMGTAVRSAESLYRLVCAAFAGVQSAAGARPATAVSAAIKYLERGEDGGPICREPSIEALLAVLGRVAHDQSAGPPVNRSGPFLPAYLDRLASFSDYLRCFDVLPGQQEELRLSMFKLCAETIGFCLADFAHWAEARSGPPAGLSQVATLLGEGM